MRIEIGIGIPSGWGRGRGVRVLHRFQICSTYVYPFAYAFLPLFALHFNALSSLNRWRYTVHSHTPAHTRFHPHTPTWSHNPTQTPIAAAFFSSQLVSISRFLLNLPPTCPRPASEPYPYHLLPSPAREAQLTGPTGSTDEARCIMPGHTFSNSIPA